MPLAISNPPIPLPLLLLLLALLLAAGLLAGAGIIYWWLRWRRRASASISSIRLTDYETSEERDVHH